MKWFKSKDKQKKVVKTIDSQIMVSALENRHLSIFYKESPLVVIKGVNPGVRHVFSEKMRNLCKNNGFQFEDNVQKEEIIITTKDRKIILHIDYYYEVHRGEIELNMNEMVILFPKEKNEIDFSTSYHFLTTMFFNHL